MINAVLKIGAKYRKPIVKYSKIAIRDAKNCRYIAKDISKGLKQASRLSKMQNQSIFGKLGTQSIATARQVNKHLPGLLAAISIPSPAPSAIVYVIGKYLQKALTKVL